MLLLLHLVLMFFTIEFVEEAKVVALWFLVLGLLVLLR